MAIYSLSLGFHACLRAEEGAVYKTGQHVVCSLASPNGKHGSQADWPCTICSNYTEAAKGTPSRVGHDARTYIVAEQGRAEQNRAEPSMGLEYLANVIGAIQPGKRPGDWPALPAHGYKRYGAVADDDNDFPSQFIGGVSYLHTVREDQAGVG